MKNFNCFLWYMILTVISTSILSGDQENKPKSNLLDILIEKGDIPIISQGKTLQRCGALEVVYDKNTGNFTGLIHKTRTHRQLDNRSN